MNCRIGSQSAFRYGMRYFSRMVKKAALRDWRSGFPVTYHEGIIVPDLDHAFELTKDGAQRIETGRLPRLMPTKVAHLDWHNDLSRLLLESVKPSAIRPTNVEGRL